MLDTLLIQVWGSSFHINYSHWLEHATLDSRQSCCEASPLTMLEYSKRRKKNNLAIQQKRFPHSVLQLSPKNALRAIQVSVCLTGVELVMDLVASLPFSL